MFAMAGSFGDWEKAMLLQVLPQRRIEGSIRLYFEEYGLVFPANSVNLGNQIWDPFSNWSFGNIGNGVAQGK